MKFRIVQNDFTMKYKIQSKFLFYWIACCDDPYETYTSFTEANKQKVEMQQQWETQKKLEKSKWKVVTNV